MNKHSGFSLFEVILAFFVLAFILGQLVVSMGESRQGINLNKEAIVAQAAVNELNEQLLTIPFNDLPEGTFSDLKDGQEVAVGSKWRFRIADSTVRRSCTISTVKNVEGIVLYKIIAAEISWSTQDQPGKTKTLKVSAVYPKDGA